ncbi:MAG: type III-B CRISPR module RAMP protein Cmr4 [Aestuariivita sp.]|nr:type III-B CRISPR module RAMP protein Cmr4 [Aestuariivita sp.]
MQTTSEITLMFLHCLTAIHPGSGRAMDVVDLPVQRERHTQWPTIPASTLKGVLRSSNQSTDEEWVLAAFGSKSDNNNANAGAISISDARIIAFPVRSLKGVFAWTTCPAILDRLRRDITIANYPPIESFDFSNVSGNQVLCPKDSPLLIENSRMLLEEFDFERVGHDQGIGDWIAQHSVLDQPTAKRIQSHMVVVSDDAFGHFVRHATDISARIALDSETRTVKQGALFYEEHLPPETIFYALISSTDSRRETYSAKAINIIQKICDETSRTLQIGGNSTLGKGLCAVRIENKSELS